MTQDLAAAAEARETILPALAEASVNARPREQQVLGRIGSLETRLAANAREVEAAQRLRYRVFADEMKAKLSPSSHAERRDHDGFDPICDHLVVLDNAIDADPEDQIVATYRLLRQDVAERHDGFYSAAEFDIGPLLDRHPGLRFLELGRSCVLPAYRNRRTAELLWQGNWAYALKHRMDVLFGCASFSGTVPAEHALALSFLHHAIRAHGAWQVSARSELFATMDLMPEEAVNPKRALMAMPPLIKGYLRLGAMVADGAVVDQAFGTTDVLIVLPVTAISERYIHHYGADATRFAS